jgi:hypothetical protein
MEQFIHRYFTLTRAAALIAGLFSFGLVSGSFFLGGCAHTVEYQTQHDTDTVIHHDTISGPAFLRFISILNNPIGPPSVSPIVSLSTQGFQNPDQFASVGPVMQNQFYPVPHDSAFYLYASYFIDATNTKKNDSIPVPKLKPYSLTTIALFKNNGISDFNRLSPVFSDDSVRKNLIPNNSCFVRLINGVPDYPQPFPSVNMHVDDINAPPLFKDNVSYQDIRNYVLIPAGNHQIFVRSETDVTQSYSQSYQFMAGQFYTIRLTGKHTDSSDQLTIDAE